MVYDLEQFIADCRSTLERDPGPAGREQLRANLERLLANADFVREHCGDDVPRGRKVLYEESARQIRSEPSMICRRQPIMG